MKARSTEHSLQIAYLGPAGTFSEEVAARYAREKKAFTVPVQTLEEVCEGIRDDCWHEGLVPVENSTEGTVGQVMDLLAENTDLKIRGEILHPVRHCLLVPDGVKAEQIEAVLSHPQALGQCRRYLKENHPGVAVVETTSTAHAAREVAACGYPRAAIASPAAAVTYGLQIAAENINDCKENMTRFLVLGNGDVGPEPGRASKTSIILTVGDRPGALHSILSEFAYRGINLTRIESRPAKKTLGEYIFFIDFYGHKCCPDIEEALKSIAGKCTTCRIVGSYPAARKLNDFHVHDSLENLRRNIDRVDREIIDLLARRMALSDRAARYKNEGNVRDAEREGEILAHIIREGRKRGLDPIILNRLYREILDYSVHRQKAILTEQFKTSLCSRE